MQLIVLKEHWGLLFVQCTVNIICSQYKPRSWPVLQWQRNTYMKGCVLGKSLFLCEVAWRNAGFNCDKCRCEWLNVPQHLFGLWFHRQILVSISSYFAFIRVLFLKTWSFEQHSFTRLNQETRIFESSSWPCTGKPQGQFSTSNSEASCKMEK